MINKFKALLDKKLFYAGFSTKEMRQLFINQILFSLSLLIASVLFAPFTFFLCYISAGNLIALWNFWFLAKSIHSLLNKQSFSSLGFLLHFCLRLTFTALLLSIGIIYLKLPLLPFISGLSSVLGVLLYRVFKQHISLRYK